MSGYIMIDFEDCTYSTLTAGDVLEGLFNKLDNAIKTQKMVIAKGIISGDGNEFNPIPCTVRYIRTTTDVIQIAPQGQSIKYIDNTDTIVTV